MEFIQFIMTFKYVGTRDEIFLSIEKLYTIMVYFIKIHTKHLIRKWNWSFKLDLEEEKPVKNVRANENSGDPEKLVMAAEMVMDI